MTRQTLIEDTQRSNCVQEQRLGECREIIFYAKHVRCGLSIRARVRIIGVRQAHEKRRRGPPGDTLSTKKNRESMLPPSHTSSFDSRASSRRPLERTIHCGTIPHGIAQGRHRAVSRLSPKTRETGTSSLNSVRADVRQGLPRVRWFRGRRCDRSRFRTPEARSRLSRNWQLQGCNPRSASVPDGTSNVNRDGGVIIRRGITRGRRHAVGDANARSQDGGLCGYLELNTVKRLCYCPRIAGGAQYCLWTRFN